jgi:hypothetical protein
MKFDICARKQSTHSSKASMNPESKINLVVAKKNHIVAMQEWDPQPAREILNLSGITTLAKLCTFPATNWTDEDEDMQNKQYQDEHHCSTQATCIHCSHYLCSDRCAVLQFEGTMQ